MTNQAAGTIRLLICDDQAIVCEGLRAILEPVPQIEIVGVANNGIDAIDLTRTNGLQATKAIREQFPDVHVLVLTTYDEDEWVIDAVRYGAAGYLLKDTPQEDLIKAIVDTVSGWSHIDPQVAGKILKHVSHQPARTAPDRNLIGQLSDREREVLRLLATGLSNAKLGVTDRTQAAILAIRVGLVSP
jgi:DNA-binding NarL/FixJ family response regulator